MQSNRRHCWCCIHLIQQQDWHFPKQRKLHQVLQFFSPCLQRMSPAWKPKWRKDKHVVRQANEVEIEAEKVIHKASFTGKIFQKLTNAKLVRGPNASIDTSPGYSDTLSTKNSDALFSIFLDFGGGKNMLPSPSEPWTKSAMHGAPP